MHRKLILLYGVASFLLGCVLGALLLADRSWYAVMLFGALVALIGTLPALILDRRTSRPLTDIAEATRKIIAGHYAHRITVTGEGEIGRLVRSFNTMSDRLTEQFAQVDEDRQQLRTILGAMVEGVIAIDEQQRLLFTNECASQMLEFHPRTTIGRKFWEIVRHKPIVALVDRALATREKVKEEFDLKAHGRSVTLYVSPLALGHGAILVMQDTSELRRLERLRHEFVANVSHELKTPLAVIIANVETLLDGAIDDVDVRVDFLETISEQSERLHSLILDLLSLARIESGQQSLDFERVIIANCVDECFDRQRSRAEARNQTLAFKPPNEPSASEIWTDREALGQILDNLLDNAIKYTPDGSQIQVQWYGCGNQVCIEVLDNGPGIPEADLPRIFERFYRVDKARSRELGGTGLGLAIVKNLAQVLKGAVNVTSIVGQGTTFTVCLPRTPT